MGSDLKLTGGYTLDREYDMRGIMIPRIGDLLYYDTLDMLAVVQEPNDLRFVNERYIPVGVIANISNDLKTLKLITPYLIQVSFDMKERISEKNMIKQIKSFVRAYTKDMFKKELEDMKFNLTTTADLQLLIDNSDAVIKGITAFTDNTNIPLKEPILNIISKGLLIYTDKDSLLITYGLSDNFNKISTHDIRMQDRDTALNNVKKLKDFKDSFPSLEKLDGYIIPIATIKLD